MSEIQNTTAGLLGTVMSAHYGNFERMHIRSELIEPSPRLAGVVQMFCDYQFDDSATRRQYAGWCLPTASPRLSLHYGSPVSSGRWLNSRSFRSLVAGIQTDGDTIYATGPLRQVAVLLKPEAAASLTTASMGEVFNRAVELSDLLGANPVSILHEQLAEAPDSRARVACVEAFILRHIHLDRLDPLVLEAAARLRRNPTLPINQLASNLGVSTRHLSRRFRAVCHISPKLFTRIGRLGRVIARRCRGATWADVATACGYADQSHMVADFSALVGCGPDQYFRAISSTPSCRDTNAASLLAGFRCLVVPINTAPEPRHFLRQLVRRRFA
jgi:AraC-like DNA-binding protein